MILALDTATSTASIALFDRAAGRLLAEQTWEADRKQTETLLPAVEQLLALAGVVPAQLTALAVTTGPGSFTGVRIAVSAAKGIALGLAHPLQVVGFPTLAVTAAPWLPLAPVVAGKQTAVWSVLQAGRGRCNWCIFTPNDLLARPGAEAHHSGSAADLLAALAAADRAPIWLVGEITPDNFAPEPLPAHVYAVEPAFGLRRAGALAALAVRFLAHHPGDDLATLQPLYLRAP